MRNLKLTFTLTLLIFFSCSRSWTTVIKYGSTEKEAYVDSTEIAVKLGLMIVPVEINGKRYDFLFDSGAPTSISQSLSDELQLKQISNGKFIDSDNNKAALRFVSLEEIRIGSRTFYDQTAFIADFAANPNIECLGIDGIIGSNTQRFCNWVVDMPSKMIHFSNQEFLYDSASYSSISFSSDRQFDMHIDLRTDSAKITNIKIDYGSNGGITLPPSYFKKLTSREGKDSVWSIEGYSQSGLVGTLKESQNYIANLDHVYLGELERSNVYLRSGGSALLGCELLGRQKVIIDWSHKKLHFEMNPDTASKYSSYGIKLSKDDEKVFIQSVYNNAGLQDSLFYPLMEVLQYDEYDLKNGDSFCDYLLNREKGDSIRVVVKDSTMAVKEHYLKLISAP